MSTTAPHARPTAGRRRAVRSTVLLGTVLLLAGCADTPLSTMEPESPTAETLNTFLMWLLVASAVIFVLVQGAVIYMARKFRVRAPEDESELYPDEEFPEQVHGNIRLEIGWTLIPTVIMAVIAFFTLALLFDLSDLAEADDDQIESVTVVGQQWWWEFQYHLDDDGVPDIVTAGELVLPVGEEVRLDVTSRDVIHSFWVPALHGKRDAVPGKLSPWSIEAGAVGRFPGECTEFCGLSHAYMEKFAIGLELDDWLEWADNQRRDAVAPLQNPNLSAAEAESAQKGWEIFSNQCASCHIINGLTSVAAEDGETDTFAAYDGANRLLDKQQQVSGAAPNLTHLATRTSFAGGVFDLYKNVDLPYLTLAEDGVLNRGDLEAWIINAPEQKANDWDSPVGQRGMTPFESLSAEEVDHLVDFLMSLD